MGKGPGEHSSLAPKTTSPPPSCQFEIYTSLSYFRHFFSLALNVKMLIPGSLPSYSEQKRGPPWPPRTITLTYQLIILELFFVVQ